MLIVKHSFARGLNTVLKNPGVSTATVLFGVAITLVASNALFSQSSGHPAPIWKSQDNFITQTVEAKPEIVTAKRVQPHKVLTQSISLKNIPVPTSNPSKPKSFAARSSLVREVQSSLADVGIYDGKVDGIYGDETRRAIREYQDKAGIIPDGEASFSLLANIKSAFAVAQIQNANDKVAATSDTASANVPELIVLDHSMVSRVQTGLKEIYGDQEISVDGIFGSQTRQALKRFQERFKIPATGELDQKTIEKLREAGVVNSI